ncbi:MAG TPA: hypothetical protein ENN39_00970 [Desulfonatronum sp.]|nr:hypothetical protein [Desulfonatronum sp.]
MKRFAVLALLAAFILGSVGIAQAVEIKAKGVWRVHANYIKNRDFNGDTKEDNFFAMQRARTIFEFIASENLKAVLQFEIGNTRWGGPGGGALNTDGTNVKTKHAYLQFKLPNTEVDIKAGLQGVALPSTMGSHILSADVAAFVASIPFNDMLGLTLGWARPYDLETVNPDDPTEKWDDEVDVFMAILPVSLDGVSLKPFVAYSRWGKDFTGSGKNANMWHGGLNFAVTMLDPIAIKGDFNYGTVKWATGYKQNGWIADLAVEYKMDMVTPQIFGFYESGEKSNSTDSKRMPVIGTDGGAFGPGVALGQQTTFGGGDSFVRSLLGGYQNLEGAIGAWGIGAALRNITFMEDLSHNLVAYYAKGTNANEYWGLMTKKDKLWEVDFNTKYQMYENLALVLELAYAKVDLNDFGTGFRGDIADDGLYRGILGFVYSF